MINPAEYTINIRQGNFEGEACFEARIKELPDVAEYGDSVEEAYQLALDTIETTAEIFAQKGRSMPEPAPTLDDYSGRVTLRLPKSLHRALAEKAETEGISLNQMLVTILGAYRGFDGAMTHAHADWVAVGHPKRTGERPRLQVVSQRSLQRPS